MRKLLFLSLIVLLSALFTQQALAQKQGNKENHRDYADMKITECNDCHKGEGVSPNHDADWIRNHRVTASKAGHNCAQCHTQAYCLDCHQGGGITADLSTAQFGRDYIPKSHRSDFVNIHPLKALDNPQTCYRCHDKSYCQACHDRFPRGSMRIKSHLPTGSNSQSYVWTSEHSTEARRNLQSCQSCHPEGDVCLRCHSATSGARINPHPRDFQGGNISARTKRTCRICH
ncbi:cytochrome C [Geomonas sp. Red32]|uniref:cytochrome C n=1 Tax=Geomonas sp. Red32 TaxID=2912856 RepID=UPI00202CB793|nr:cytochrome C [Geomonas sp. Red32]